MLTQKAFQLLNPVFRKIYTYNYRKMSFEATTGEGKEEHTNDRKAANQ